MQILYPLVLIALLLLLLWIGWKILRKICPEETALLFQDEPTKAELKAKLKMDKASDAARIAGQVSKIDPKKTKKNERIIHTFLKE